MVQISVKGYEFNTIVVKDSFNRRATQYQNNIITSLKRIGLTEDDIDAEFKGNAMRRGPASVSWYIGGTHLHYSYGLCDKFVENLYVVSKVIEFEVNAIVAGKKTFEDSINDFSEHHDIKKRRDAAREVLGFGDENLDPEVLDKRYKELAKEHHPDKPGGNHEKFKEINTAHKVLKREFN